MEEKLSQQLTGMCHEPFSGFLICIEILRLVKYSNMHGDTKGYGRGPNPHRLIHGKFFGGAFGKEIGVTQGDPVSPKIFIIVVDAVVTVVLLEV